MSITSDLIHYLRRPVFTAQRQAFGATMMTELAKLWGLALGLAILSVIMVTSAYIIINGQPSQTANGFEDLTQSSRFFFVAVIMAPLLEETLFRSWLGYIRGVLLAMPILLCLSVIIFALSQKDVTAFIKLSAVLITLTAFLAYLRRYKQTKKITGHHQAVTQHIFPFMFWGSAISFGLIHIGNYAADGFQLHIVLLVIPQFIIGTILGFVRMRYGLPAAIGFHGAYNSVFVGLASFA